MEYWYLWLILAALVVAFIVVMRFANKALQAHNNERDDMLNNLKRLKMLKDKYIQLSTELVKATDSLELLEGVSAVMQARVEKSDNPNLEFINFTDAQKNIYTLNYFVEDVRESLSFFFKNNGEPLVSVAVPALQSIGCNKEAETAEKVFAMYDENNEDVSIEVQKMKELDEQFRLSYDEKALLEKTKEYILNNIKEF